MKCNWRGEAGKIASQVFLACWNYLLSDSNESEQRKGIPIITIEEKVQICDPFLALMADIDGSEDKPTTLLSIKENPKDYSLTRLTSLASILIESLNDLAKDKKI